MILNATNDSLELTLSGSVTTRQVNYYTSYHALTSSSINSTYTAGLSNNTTAVTIVPAPATSTQHQLRYCSIYNCDTAGQTVTIRLKSSSSYRTVFIAYLFVGEYIQYTPSSGWRVYNHNGIMKTNGTAINPSGPKTLPFFNAINTTTTQTLLSGITYGFYLGTADRQYDLVTLLAGVTTAGAGTTSLQSEVAIYKGYPTIGSNATLTRCGLVNTTTGVDFGFNTTGTKTIPIPVSGITAGDDIWAIFACSANTTQSVIRAGVSDNISSGIVQTGTSKPSLNSTLSLTVSNAINLAWLNWQGFQR